MSKICDVFETCEQCQASDFTETEAEQIKAKVEAIGCIACSKAYSRCCLTCYTINPCFVLPGTPEAERSIKRDIALFGLPEDTLGFVKKLDKTNFQQRFTNSQN